MRYSGHNLELLRKLQKEGLSDEVKVVEMNPPDMASALFAGALDAYFVGEPFAAQTIRAGASTKLYHAEELCPDFICNLLIMRDKTIKKNPEAVTRLVQGAVKSGFWASKHPAEAAEIVSTYWNQPVELITWALTTPPGRFEYTQYIPYRKELQHMANLMVRFNMLDDKDISGIVNDEFARNVSPGNVLKVEEIFNQ
jgi:NitT/TauT family transport system substrate-binding protein